MNASADLRVALLGCGVVGSHVARSLLMSPDLAAQVGTSVTLVGVAVRDLAKPRDGVPTALITTDLEALIRDADIVIELMGGIEPARTLILDAMKHGASVVTANKALLATVGPELYTAAQDCGVDLYFEAAVAGAIPIIRPLRESLVGDHILSVKGIVNGTTNYILDQMTLTGATFEQALRQAQDLGFAEADPTADVEGFDAAAKASVLASLGFRAQILGEQVAREGITHISADDIAAAQRLGYVVKLVASAIPLESDPTQIAVQVHPTMVPTSHPLAAVHGGNNAILIESANAGRLMFMGPGAGGAPTASAVIGDLVTVARNKVRGIHFPPMPAAQNRTAAPADDLVVQTYLSMRVADEPGVLAQVATVFAHQGVSISAVHQNQVGTDPGTVSLAVTTHSTRWGQINQATADLMALPGIVRGEIRVYNVEGV